MTRVLATLPLTRFASKLGRRCDLSLEDRTALLSLPSVQRSFAPGEAIAGNAAAENAVCILNDGFVSCFKMVQEKHPQIVAFAMPGDAVDMPAILLGRSSVHAQAHVPTETTWVRHEDILALCSKYARLAQAFWLDSLIDADIAREWTANVGQRPAQARLAHLLLELHDRFAAVGLCRENTFELPVVQSVMASALGLSLVHYNKTLRRLVASGQVRTIHRLIEMRDIARLRTEVGYDGRYLTVGDPGRAQNEPSFAGAGDSR